MSRGQKIALVAVLGLGGIIPVFFVVRVVVTSDTTKLAEISCLALWSAVESSVAVMVECLASYKVLFSQKQQRRKYTTTKTQPTARGSRSKNRDLSTTRSAVMRMVLESWRYVTKRSWSASRGGTSGGGSLLPRPLSWRLGKARTGMRHCIVAADHSNEFSEAVGVKYVSNAIRPISNYAHLNAMMFLLCISLNRRNSSILI